MQTNHPPYALAHEHAVCTDLDHLRRELARVEALGGEGLMLRQPGSKYAVGRSLTLLKIKSFIDSEARVAGHEPGKGRHKGRLGALLAELADGTKFSVGTGFSDAERGSPPAIGSTITFRYQELTDGGVPRFPSYVGVRAAAPVALKSIHANKGESTMPSTSSKRRFEYVSGSSDKFWEIQVKGKEVLVHFGRNGTNGQSSTKSFADEVAAQQHTDKLIAEKTGKGYVEI